MNISRKKVILFHPGASGHFLSEFLANDDDGILKPQFRLDFMQQSNSAVFASDLPTIRNLIVNGLRDTILSHEMNIEQLSDLADNLWIKKIYPCSNLFGLIKNIVFKKQQVEIIDWSSSHYLQQFDGYFENISNWYSRLSQDPCPVPEQLIDFGQLYNIDYLASVHESYHGKSPNLNKINFAQDYIKKQFLPINDTTSTDINKIIQQVNPSSLFDLAVVLFIYEKNYNTVDQNRMWTIDSLPGDLDSAVSFLIGNAKNYTIFQ
jgi:hypothetical protein